MNEEIISKIKNWLLNHIVNIALVIVAISSIAFSFYYVNSHKCKPCDSCDDVVESAEPKASKLYKVDVKGAVVNPKVYTLEEGATVEDAIHMAGGVKAGGTTENINLSKKVQDEMVIYVFTKEEIAKESSSNEVVCEVPKCNCEKIVVNSCISPNGKKTTSNTNSKTSTNSNSKSMSDELTGPVNINTASLDELQKLTGIGESKAKAIISYRETKGNFKTIEDVKNVNGIGDALYEKIKNNITT